MRGSHAALHNLAKENLLGGPLEGDVYAAAVLRHDKTYSTCQPVADFTWFKLKGKYTIGKLRKAYLAQKGYEIDVLQKENPVSDEVQIQNLNTFGDNIIAFTSRVLVNGAALLSNTSSQRQPLSPSNGQRRAVPAVSAAISSTKPVNTISPLYHKEHSSFGSHSPQFPRRTVTHNTPQSHKHVKVKDESIHESSMASDSLPLFPENELHRSYSQNVGDFTGHKTQGSRLLDSAVPSSSSVQTSTSSRIVKTEDPEATKSEKIKVDADTSMSELAALSAAAQPPQNRESVRLQMLVQNGVPEVLEAEVRKNQEFLKTLKTALASMIDQDRDAHYFTQQIQTLQDQQVETPTIIGVVGNTGAGKSSVINALLEEERLVPTNCMRACTAVVTEMSWNPSEDENSKYRADIEFIKAEDWKKDLVLSLNELLDGSGQVSRECTNADTEAGIAYAKIKAVYPQKTKDQLANSTVDELMNDQAVKAVLGTTKKIQQANPEPFYKSLQHYVDSKEKVTESKNKTKEKGEKKQMEFWPLIKVVRIYTRADALSTGAVIVDLPGVHDSNAARAAVAAGYMKQCTGLWIVAPINRAVDDKAAKSLLGESFKRQLKYDGTYSRITFICSKTDDISIMEASDSLGLEEQMADDWEKVDQIEKDKSGLKKSLKELKESRAVYGEVMNDAEDKIDIWDALKSDLEDGKTVYAPTNKSKKRKRSAAEQKESRKKSKKPRTSEEDEDDEDDDDEDEDSESEAEKDSEYSSEAGDPLTIDLIDEKLAELKEDKKKARKERAELDAKVRSANHDLEILHKSHREIEARMRALCIQGRNNYSKGAIRQDFAAGIKELDMENAQEDEDFNPEAEDLRDYDEVARSLPVFCVSSRAAQKLAGRLQRDSDVPGFRTNEETEIPQLRQHCKMLTEAGRASNCRLFLTNFSQLLTSLGIWASNDGTGLNLSDSQMAVESRFLKNRLVTLEKSLDNAIFECLNEMNQALAENIFENYEHVVQLATDAAAPEVDHWHAPVNREDRKAGGYYWATYKAIMRREGVYANAQGPHDFNAKLTEPIVKHLASHWEKVFAQRLPRVLQNFSRNSRQLLSEFHNDIESRSMKQGAGVAGIAMLGQQLRNYEAIFQTVATQMGDVINALQREANREFTPVIARNLATAYDWCAAESGPGQYVRMKQYMKDHVESRRGGMFQESCDEVRNRLNRMVQEVEEAMANKTDEVFVCMTRDYTEIILGKECEDGVMPKAERQMRSACAKLIQDKEDASAKLEKIKEEDKVAHKSDPAANDKDEHNNDDELSG